MLFIYLGVAWCLKPALSGQGDTKNARQTLQELYIHEFLFLIQCVHTNPAENIYLDTNLVSV